MKDNDDLQEQIKNLVWEEVKIKLNFLSDLMPRKSLHEHSLTPQQIIERFINEFERGY